MYKYSINVQITSLITFGAYTNLNSILSKLNSNLKSVTKTNDIQREEHNTVLLIYIYRSVQVPVKIHFMKCKFYKQFFLLNAPNSTSTLCITEQHVKSLLLNWSVRIPISNPENRIAGHLDTKWYKHILWFLLSHYCLYSFVQRLLRRIANPNP